MTDTDLGTAVIVYDDPDEGTVEKRVENENIAYFQDHWIVKLDEDAGGNDVVRRIPIQRVHYVERSVEEFETEVKTLRNQVESFAKNLQSSLLGGRDDADADAQTEEPQRIEVEDGRSNE
ncbi:MULTISPECIES: hypothetical protein [Haloferax]|uniref:Uncharacterized protein n=2 Tax=Haloferax gibbonsii TaxID=35746 RepID=A0A0K1IU81_HALGI|nr:MULTISPECIES: hypothetical protein [Haloferax]AKU08021.1 hypothetical protein ABY42_09810 [Haloferax gibbonsii]ELZ80067.1 hypothetical protein C454_12723 [Haloferax gibbonsii ATCC 33959]QOS12884.1 uncharacterized protein HfgLR_13780 [Haloferax gibbonsii]RDZ52832.1 hypothetical protein C5C07_13825 [Haloferax sp. Atlit-4N]REA02158.1 hypothetical protein DEQ92_14790 [Haloferax sp. Atlit-6N]